MLKYILTALLLLIGSNVSSEYTADWDSLDSRPLPQWYDDAKIGIFLHWGLYSVQSYGSEWFWWYWQGEQTEKYVDYMNANYRPGFKYQEFSPLFTAEFFEPDEWADLFEAAGAKYIVLTSKHHEGFTMWPSNFSWGWNALESGAHRDLLGDLANSIKKKNDIHFGLYYSHYEWFNPMYLMDKKNNFETSAFVMSKSLPELHEITMLYKPEVIWTDGDWEAQDSYWRSKQFLAWLFNESPVKETVVVNDRWGSGIPCHHGSFYTCYDRYNPGVLLDHKWENCMTLDKSSWGYRRASKSRDYLTIEELIKTMIETISCGGNLLVNAGPTHDGRIAPIMEERLRQMGSWLNLNGEAIYSSVPWIYQNDSLTQGVWYTRRDEFVYATLLHWPSDEKVTFGSVTNEVVADPDKFDVSLVGCDDRIKSYLTDDGLEIVLPTLAHVKGDWAWVFKLTGLKLRRPN